MVRFVCGEFGVICVKRKSPALAWVLDQIFLRSVEEEVCFTFQSPDHAQDNLIGDDSLDDGVVVQQDQRLHDVAEAMQIHQTLQVFGHRDQGY